MNPKLLAVVALRSLATLFAASGNPKTGSSLNLLADGVEAGADVDEHMQSVADALKASGGNVSAEQWDDVHARIAADSARLQAL